MFIVALNTKVVSTTKKSPFLIVFGQKPNTLENVPSECGDLQEEELSHLIPMDETEVESVTAPEPEHQPVPVRKPRIKRPQPQAPVKPIPQPRSLPKKPIPPPPRPPPRRLLKNVQADSTNACDVEEPIEVDFFLNSNVTDDDMIELPAALTMNNKTIPAEQEDQEKITMESLLETGISVSSCSKSLPSILLDLPLSDNDSDNSVNE